MLGAICSGGTHSSEDPTSSPDPKSKSFLLYQMMGTQTRSMNMLGNEKSDHSQSVQGNRQKKMVDDIEVIPA